VTAIASYLFKLELPRSYLLIMMPAGLAALLASRFAWRRWLHRQRDAGAYMSNVLAVGNIHTVTELLRDLRRAPRAGYKVIGVCVTQSPRSVDADSEQLLAIDGVPVLVSVDFGPAIVGVVRPQIVIPAWTLALPPEQRALMMAHEVEHLARHDNRWLGAAFLAVVVAPWNIGLWWLVNRFRLALEVDCDRRVLLRGHDVEQYGNLLIRIGRHDGGRSLLAAGFAERRSMLRTRIERMTGTGSAPSGAWRIAIGLALVVAACSLGPARQHQAGGTARMEVADAIPAVSAVIPSSVRRILDRLAPPTSGAPSIVTAFSRDTVDIGDSVELVTATWFPRPLREALREMPGIRPPLISAPPGFGDQQPPIAGGTRVEAGTLYDLYVSWQTIPTSRSGRIEAAPAVLTYQLPGGTIFAPRSQTVVRSSPTVLVVRATT
jgi:hypothetical protein